MQRQRILIIDDSLTIRAIVEELLATQANCNQIAAAGDIPTARALIADFKPSLIRLDLNLPGTDGLALLNELRGHRHAPVIGYQEWF